MENKKNILLIVEDDTSLLNILNDKFSKEGFEVIKADTGKEGISEAVEYKPDMILLDIEMPGMDGIEFLKLLREDKWGKTAQVFLLTNNNDPERIADSMKYGAFNYWIKADHKLEDIVEKVKEKIFS